MNWQPMIDAGWIIQLHAGAAGAAFLLGIVMFLRVKGTLSHKVLGWTWVTLMVITAVTAIFIRTEFLPNIYGYTPIHIFVVVTLVSLPLSIMAIKRKDVRAHSSSMIGLFIGGLIIAGALAFMPGRIMHGVVFG